MLSLQKSIRIYRKSSLQNRISIRILILMSIFVAFSDFLSIALIYPLLGYLNASHLRSSPPLVFLSDTFGINPSSSNLCLLIVTIIILAATTRIILSRQLTVTSGNIAFATMSDAFDKIILSGIDVKRYHDESNVATHLGSSFDEIAAYFEALSSLVTHTLSCILLIILSVLIVGYRLFAFVALLILLYLGFDRLRTNNTSSYSSLPLYRSKLIRLVSHVYRNSEQLFFTENSEYWSSRYYETLTRLRLIRKESSFYSNLPRYCFELFIILMVCMIFIFTNLTSPSNGNNLSRTLLLIVVLYRIMPSFQQIYSSFNSLKINQEYVYNALCIIPPYLITAYRPKIQPEQYSPALTRITVDFSNRTTNIIDSNQTYTRSSKTLSFEKGFFYLIRAKTGIGKSTLIRSMAGLEESQFNDSTYEMDDNSSLDHPNHLIYSSIYFIPQDTFICEGTILDNIVYDFQDVDLNRVWKILRIICLHDDIDSLSDGIYTILTSDGFPLSGGQLQRIILGRALYSQRNWLLMDEATSALDKNTERQVLANLRSTGLTLISISHTTPHPELFDFIINISD